MSAASYCSDGRMCKSSSNGRGIPQIEGTGYLALKPTTTEPSPKALASMVQSNHSPAVTFSHLTLAAEIQEAFPIPMILTDMQDPMQCSWCAFAQNDRFSECIIHAILHETVMITKCKRMLMISRIFHTLRVHKHASNRLPPRFRSRL